MKRILWA